MKGFSRSCHLPLPPLVTGNIGGGRWGSTGYPAALGGVCGRDADRSWLLGHLVKSWGYSGGLSDVGMIDASTKGFVDRYLTLITRATYERFRTSILGQVHPTNYERFRT